MNMHLLSVMAVSTVVTASAGAAVLVALRRFDVLDHPNARSSHTRPVPRGGGIACLVGVLAGALVAALAHREVPWPALAGAVVLGGVGWADDRRGLPAFPRLLAQLVVGAMAGLLVAGWIGALAGVLVMPLLVNVTNFMDGINGITATVVLTWGLMTTWIAQRNGMEPLAMVGMLTAGAGIGFLPWNAPSARMFLGDVGSYFLGALCAGGVLVALGSRPELVLSVLAPLGVYLADVLTVIISRARRGVTLTEAHREHVYQRLVDRHRFRHLSVTMIVMIASAATCLPWVLLSPAIAAPLSLVPVLMYLSLPHALSRRLEVEQP